MLSTLVGAVSMARAVNDDKLSRGNPAGPRPTI